LLDIKKVLQPFIHSDLDWKGVFGYTKILAEDLGYPEDEMTVGYGP